jgi:hypothetical protein
VDVGFGPAAGGAVELWLGRGESRLLRSVLADIAEFVEPSPADPGADPLATMVGIEVDVETPDDPAALRLFPDAYPDDDEASGEFRRFTERSLRQAKHDRALMALGTLDRLDDLLGRDVQRDDAADGTDHGDDDELSSCVVLTRDEALSWLGVLNDLRLVLGERLGLTEDNHDELEALPMDHPAAGAYALYQFLTYLQDTCVDAVARR